MMDETNWFSQADLFSLLRNSNIVVDAEDAEDTEDADDAVTHRLHLLLQSYWLAYPRKGIVDIASTLHGGFLCSYLLSFCNTTDHPSTKMLPSRVFIKLEQFSSYVPFASSSLIRI